MSEHKQDAAAYRAMALEYQRRCADSPQISRYILARNAGLRAFNVSLADVLSDCRKQHIAQPRMKIMAATVVLTGGSHSGVGRVFNRWQSTVAHAVSLYGESVRRVLAQAAA
ncbi:hypothetical protein I6F35_02965 [Bradyrhizobium sp. BRP22]|uniref:helix-turn-helix domain-containing protein n=1 Tax=Bradyrhizobium sp. BRP22 TaxID=2793821 RepID=UPI001CD61904|nr:helix-turn-helix domain-containing protein [Bradyrhizobium sp. BRP22]MCA1452176.1 hypothetical protein [Bradyrhizobium sp. BRP22]